MAASAEPEENFMLPVERWLPERDVLPKSFRSCAQQILNIPLKDDDIWVITFPKSGTLYRLVVGCLRVHKHSTFFFLRLGKVRLVWVRFGELAMLSHKLRVVRRA